MAKVIKKFKDEYLKKDILDALEKLKNFLKNSNKGMSITYYEGNFREDVLNNFSTTQSEEIFKDMSKYLNDWRLIFFQKKIRMKNTNENVPENIEPKHFFEYIVSKRVY
jgi:hypothetical protein